MVIHDHNQLIKVTTENIAKLCKIIIILHHDGLSQSKQNSMLLLDYLLDTIDYSVIDEIIKNAVTYSFQWKEIDQFKVLFKKKTRTTRKKTRTKRRKSDSICTTTTTTITTTLSISRITSKKKKKKKINSSVKKVKRSKKTVPHVSLIEYNPRLLDDSLSDTEIQVSNEPVNNVCHADWSVPNVITTEIQNKGNQQQQQQESEQEQIADESEQEEQVVEKEQQMVKEESEQESEEEFEEEEQVAGEQSGEQSAEESGEESGEEEQVVEKVEEKEFVVQPQPLQKEVAKHILTEVNPNLKKEKKNQNISTICKTANQ